MNKFTGLSELGLAVRALAIAAIFYGATTAHADEPPWRAVMAQAWARVPYSLALAEHAQQAQAAMLAARAYTPTPPTASVGSSTDRFTRGAQRSGRQEWALELSTPLWLVGQRDAAQAGAAAEQARWEAELAERQWALAGQLREAWWELAAARDAVALRRAHAQTAQALWADVARRHRAGDLARTDANAAEADAHAAQAELMGATDDERLAADRWQALTGAQPPVDLPSERLTVDAKAGAAGVATGADSGLGGPASRAPLWLPQAHPRWRAAEAASRALEQRLAMATAATREAPELAFKVIRERGDATEPYANAVGWRLSVPLSSAPRNTRDSAALRAEWVEAHAAQGLLTQTLTMALAAAYRAQATLGEKTALAERRAALAADTLQLLEKSFALGERDLPSLLRARAAAFDAQAELRRLRVAQRAVISRIQQARGVLP